MAQRIRTYAAAPARERGSLKPLAGLMALLVIAAFLVWFTTDGRGERELTGAPSQPAVETTALGDRATVLEHGREGAARTAAGYLSAVGRAAVANDPAARRAVVEEWVLPERQRGELESFEAVHHDLAALLGEAGARPGHVATRAIPLGYRVLDFAPDRARVQVWQLFTVLGASWPGVTSWSTADVALRWSAGGWRIESGSEGLDGPALPGGQVSGVADTARLASRVEQFTPFEP